MTRPGRTADGAEYTCYSLMMELAAGHWEHVHDRMPLLINPGFAEDWLTTPSPGGPARCGDRRGYTTQRDDPRDSRR